jgi:hypothetical protein
MKQTAVEWLYEHILLTPLDIRSINKCLEQAKEMEKEQIVKAYTDTLEFTPENISKGEQYYNENYNL